MPFATVNSLQLHYELEGQGHPVVLIHWRFSLPRFAFSESTSGGTAALPFHRRHTRWEDLPPTCTPGGAMEG